MPSYFLVDDLTKAHLAFIGALSQAERETLKRTCENRGFHQPSGVMKPMSEPIHQCLFCGNEYQVTSNGYRF
jgi:hypothetical protein